MQMGRFLDKKAEAKQKFKKIMFLQLVKNFADFLRNNSIIMQNSSTFKKYHLREKFIFQQLVVKKLEFC